MNNLLANYERILEVLRNISTDRQLSIQRRRPLMSDLEVISLSLTAEYMGIDSDNDLFRKLPCCFQGKIERTVYNRRKRRLMPYQNAIRLELAESFNESEDVFIVDSMPLEVCKIARILTKITAMTVIQYINKNIFQRNINNLKIKII